MAREDQQVYAVLDEGLVCHVGYDDGGPVVVPALHGRVDGVLYVLGADDDRLAVLAQDPLPLCVTVTLTDGIVLARSQTRHSVNYRAAVVRGTATTVTDLGEKEDAMTAVIEHVLAGRSTHSRPPTAQELADTGIVRLVIEDAALQGRSGPPHDDPDDAQLPHWAGVLGVRPGYGPALPAPDLPYGRQVPAQIANYSRTARPQGYR